MCDVPHTFNAHRVIMVIIIIITQGRAPQGPSLHRQEFDVHSKRQGIPKACMRPERGGLLTRVGGEREYDIRPAG